jgi:hypothetical protein
VLPGEKINLSLGCSGFTLTDILWTLPGTVFKDYVANASAAALTPLALSDRQSTDIAFYWADTGGEQRSESDLQSEWNSV